MVTTRRGTETPGQDSSATPQSTGNKRALKREIGALDTPTAAKRQKRSTPKKKTVEEVDSIKDEENAPQSSHGPGDTIAVQRRTRSTSSTQEGRLPIRRRSSPHVVVDKLPRSAMRIEDAEEAIAEDAPTPTQESEDASVEQYGVTTTPTATKKEQDSPTPRAKRSNARKSLSKGAATEVAEEIPSSSHDSEQAVKAEDDASQPKKAHVRFGSEEPEVTLESTTINLQGHKRYEAGQTTQTEVADSDDDDASDSDEAPEVVTTSVAASTAAASRQDAARAQLAAQEKERQKREAREQRIATEQAEKRKREEKKAKRLAKQLAKDKKAVESTEPSTSLSRSVDLSGLLPASLLSNISDQRAPTPPQERSGKTEEELRQEKLNRHIKFLERSEKGVKDVKKGKLSVAVLGQKNKVLPPKANRGTRDVREKWLKGRQGDARRGAKGIGGKMERRTFGKKGFLKGED